MNFRLLTVCVVFIALGCGGGETVGTNPGQGGSAGSGGNGSGGEAGMMAMQGGTTLPPNIAQCEEGCLKARQCDLDACYSDVSGRLITDCAAACQGPNVSAFAALVNGACPDAGLQARDLLGISNQCIGETSRCPKNFCEDGSACGPEGACADGRSCTACPSDQDCVNGACGVFSCVLDAFENGGNDALGAEPLPSTDNQVLDRTLCTGDEDWFAFSLPANQNLFIDVLFGHGIGDVDVEVFDAANTEQRAFSSISASDNEQLVIPSTDVERSFVIRIFAYGMSENEYDLYLNFDVPLAVCTSSSQCSDRESCTNNACTPIPPCTSDDSCNFGTPFCDVASGVCYECLSSTDCGERGICDQNACVECVTDTDCEAGVCQENSCVECLADGDCASGQICLGNQCGSLSCRDSFEPNDTAETAVPINASMQYDGIYICGDDDFYSFSIPQGQAFIFSLTFIDEEGDIDVSIQRDGERVGSGVTTTDNEAVAFPSATAGGNYVTHVKRFSSSMDGPSEQVYGMFIDTNPPEGICNNTEDCPMGQECDGSSGLCRDEGFCNGNRDCAQEDGSQRCDVGTNTYIPYQSSEAPSTLESPTSIDVTGYRGSHDTCGGPDFYGFDLPVGKTLRVEVSFTHANGDIDVKLTDSAAMQVASSAGTEDVETFEYTSETGGFHVLEVYGFQGVYNEYQLQLIAQ